MATIDIPDVASGSGTSYTRSTAPICPIAFRGETAEETAPVVDVPPSFLLGTSHRSYKHQFANIYFVRLQLLKSIVEARAKEKWKDLPTQPVLIPRVLEVVKSQLCYIVGTVYMEMPLKPNVMEDVARDHSLPPLPLRNKFHSPDDAVMLEDESGRIHLVGERLKRQPIVTGVIMAALGLETPTGEFEVADLCFAGMASQAIVERGLRDDSEGMEEDGDPKKSESEDEWVSLVSGLDIGDTSPADAQIQLLAEYLSGEGGGSDDQQISARISRLIIVGNSLAAPENVVPATEVTSDIKPKRHGTEITTFSPYMTSVLGSFLLDVAHVMPIHILPGETDPSGALLPQQPFPRGMFGAVKDVETFSCETNPTWLGLGNRSFLVNSGQPLTDMFKYLPSPPLTHLQIATSTLHWRHMAPTAPDTLWCYPYFTSDPFVLHATPDIYVIGNQPRFQTKMVRENDHLRCRIVLVPSFAKTGIIVLLNLKTLQVRTVRLTVAGMTTGSGPAEVKAEYQ